MKKVVLIGASGFVGSAILNYCCPLKLFEPKN